MLFDPNLLRQPTNPTLIFISSAEKKPVLFPKEGAPHRSVTAEFKNEFLMLWKSKKYWVFIATEQIKYVKPVNGVDLKYTHLFHRFFLVPLGEKIIPIPAKNAHDFGYHRVKQPLLNAHAIEFLSFTDEDVMGTVINFKNKE